MAESLNEIERRVIGVLIEKSLTQPDYYPMTLNAIVAGANQKSNRHPAMSIDESDVHYTLEELRKHGLVSLVLPSPGARAQRFKHEVEAYWGWNKRQQAIMAELLLRGPQTPGQLRTRCERMFQFESLEALTTALHSLEAGESDAPMVASLAREPGQSAIRFTHLLYPEDEAPSTGPAAAPDPHIETRSPTMPATTPAAPPQSSVQPRVPEQSAEVDAMRQELDDLQEEVADLHAELAELRNRLDKVEQKTSML